MRIRWKYLLWVNGVLLALWTLYIVTDQIWDGRDMLRLEAESLRCMARMLRVASFRDGRPRPSTQALLAELTRLRPGTEVMVLDRHYVVRASSVPSRVGQRWMERDMSAGGEARSVPGARLAVSSRICDRGLTQLVIEYASRNSLGGWW